MNGYERRRWPDVVAHWIFDDVAIFRQTSPHVAWIAKRLGEDQPIWSYAHDVVRLFQKHVLAREDGALVLRSNKTGAIELELGTADVVASAKSSEHVLLLEPSRLVCYALASGEKRWERTLDAEALPSTGTQLVLGDECAWFVAGGASAEPRAEVPLVGVALADGEIVARHMLDVLEHGPVTNAVHARCGAIYQQRDTGRRSEALPVWSRFSRFDVPHTSDRMLANLDYAFSHSSGSSGTLYTPSHKTYRCHFEHDPGAVVLGPSHLVVGWPNHRFGAVALSDLEREVSRVDGWYSSWPATAEAGNDDLQREREALFDALADAGFFEHRVRGRSRVIATALSGADPASPTALCEVLRHASNTALFRVRPRQRR